MKSKLDMDRIFANIGDRSLNSALFNIANAYSQTGQLADHEVESTKNADFIAPAIMCKSFAVELLLKFFIVIAYPITYKWHELEKSGVELKGHLCSELFDRIEPTIQKKIADSFSDVSGRKTAPVAFRNALLEIGDEPFVIWRYIFEKNTLKTLNIQLLNSILLALGKAAEIERKRIVS